MMTILCLIGAAVIVVNFSVYFIIKKFSLNTAFLNNFDLQQQKQFQNLTLSLHDKISQESKQQLKELNYLQQQFTNTLSEHRERSSANQLSAQKLIQEGLQKSMQDIRLQLTQFLDSNTKSINQRMDSLTENTNKHLKEISGQVEKRLAEGFEKTTATFTDIVKRLALIDEAQKKITELSSNVVSLQNVLNDKRSRGAFGEVQLSNLIHNVMPENSFSLQYTLSNSKRCDCILFLPEPTGSLVIDAKFPLETYRRIHGEEQNNVISEHDKKLLIQQFKQDIKLHIHDIASKYIIPGETSDGAMMFIPAEAIFAEIHARHPDLVELANQKRVWLTSPTTMMAILTTACAVMKDSDTRKQVHIIQEHLVSLSKDFGRFQKRMDNLSKHIHQAQQDVTDAHTSAKKISSRFVKIERLEMSKKPDLLDTEDF